MWQPPGGAGAGPAGPGGSRGRRLLVPSGALLICHLSYLALPGDVCSATEALVLERNPAWSMAGETGIYPAWAVDAAVAGVTGRGDVPLMSWPAPGAVGRGTAGLLPSLRGGRRVRKRLARRLVVLAGATWCRGPRVSGDSCRGRVRSR